jgi:hypothetical protein
VVVEVNSVGPVQAVSVAVADALDPGKQAHRPVAMRAQGFVAGEAGTVLAQV